MNYMAENIDRLEQRDKKMKILGLYNLHIKILYSQHHLLIVH